MPPLYHCHKCNQRCTVEVRSNGALRCNRCNDGFVEDISDDAQQEEAVQIPSTSSTANRLIDLANQLLQVQGLGQGAAGPSAAFILVANTDLDMRALIQQINEDIEAGESANALRPEDIQRMAAYRVTATLDIDVNDEAKCIICRELFAQGEVVAKLDCEHIFHRSCILAWFQRKNTCPLCREVVDPSTLPPAASR